MKKIFLTLVALFSLSIPLAAEKSIDFFADEVPRYEGFALGASFINQWALGEYSDYASCNFGGEVDAEYTLPLVLPNNLDLGISARADFLVVSPKSGSTLKSENEMRFSGGQLSPQYSIKSASSSSTAAFFMSDSSSFNARAMYTPPSSSFFGFATLPAENKSRA